MARIYAAPERSRRSSESANCNLKKNYLGRTECARVRI